MASHTPPVAAAARQALFHHPAAATLTPPSPPCFTQKKVEEIALLNTVLLRADGTRCYLSNARLAGEPLANLSRSANKSESIKVRGGGGRGRERWCCCRACYSEADAARHGVQSWCCLPVASR